MLRQTGAMTRWRPVFSIRYSWSSANDSNFNIISNRIRQGVQNDVADTKCMSIKLPRFTWSSSQCTNSGNDGYFVVPAREISLGCNGCKQVRWALLYMYILVQHLLPIGPHNAAAQFVMKGIGQREHDLVSIGAQQSLEGVSGYDKCNWIVLRLVQLQRKSINVSNWE